METERRRHDWLQTLVTIAGTVILNVAGLSYVYGKLDQRVATLEQLRLEARAEVQQQLAELKRGMENIDAKLTLLLRDRR